MGKPEMLQFMGLQRIRNDLANKQQTHFPPAHLSMRIHENESKRILDMFRTMNRKALVYLPSDLSS